MGDPVQPGDSTLGETSIRVMVPRVRRAIEGAGKASVISDDAVKDIIADSLSSLILYTGGVFGKSLIVNTYTVDTFGNNIPTEYSTNQSLSLSEQVAVSAQAALDYYFFEWSGLKVSETIGDESANWSYDLSPMLLKQQLDLLIATRDKALQAISDRGVGLDSYTSFLEARDFQTSRLVESWRHYPGGTSPTVDYRFGTLG